MVFVNYTSLRSSFYSFLALQVTPKTLADVKGGTLISYEGKVQVNIVFGYACFLILPPYFSLNVQ